MGELYATLAANRNFMYEMADKADNKMQNRIDCAGLFAIASEQATKFCIQIQDLAGKLGFCQSTAFDRYVRDCKLYEIGGGTLEIRKWLIGRELTKQ